MKSLKRLVLAGVVCCTAATASWQAPEVMCNGSTSLLQAPEVMCNGSTSLSRKETCKRYIKLIEERKNPIEMIDIARNISQDIVTAFKEHAFPHARALINAFGQENDREQSLGARLRGFLALEELNDREKYVRALPKLERGAKWESDEEKTETINVLTGGINIAELHIDDLVKSGNAVQTKYNENGPYEITYMNLDLNTNIFKNIIEVLVGRYTLNDIITIFDETNSVEAPRQYPIQGVKKWLSSVSCTDSSISSTSFDISCLISCVTLNNPNVILSVKQLNDDILYIDTLLCIYNTTIRNKLLGMLPHASL
jgi:hypothetical protein